MIDKYSVGERVHNQVTLGILLPNLSMTTNYHKTRMIKSVDAWDVRHNCKDFNSYHHLKFCTIRTSAADRARVVPMCADGKDPISTKSRIRMPP